MFCNTLTLHWHAFVNKSINSPFEGFWDFVDKISAHFALMSHIFFYIVQALFWVTHCLESRVDRRYVLMLNDHLGSFPLRLDFVLVRSRLQRWLLVICRILTLLEGWLTGHLLTYFQENWLSWEFLWSYHLLTLNQMSQEGFQAYGDSSWWVVLSPRLGLGQLC